MINARPITNEELDQLKKYIAEQEQQDPIILEGAVVGVGEKYITDGPGYAGKVIMVVWPGSPDTHSVFIWDEDGNIQDAQG